MSRSEHKPLSFSTTMRNPDRMAAFLSCIKSFHGEVLTNDVIQVIAKKVINSKLYKPNFVGDNQLLNSIYEDEDGFFSDSQLTDIINNSLQNHKESGFDKGWPSRFDTWYKLSMEFGFVYYEINKPIEMSTSGLLLCDAYSNIEDDSSGEKISNIFLNALSKYQTNNPFRKNANENKPVSLLLRSIQILKEMYGQDSPGISRKEVPFITCWPDNDAWKLVNFILKFREHYGPNPSDESVYLLCLRLLNSNNLVRFKMSQLFHEGVDDFIRKMRITGIISLRGMGRFVDFNKIQLGKVDYIIQNYSDLKSFPSKYDYFKYMGGIDTNFISILADTSFDLNKVRLDALSRWSEHYTQKQITEELNNVANFRPSKDLFLRDIDRPTRLEFLTSISLKQQFPNCQVLPNYVVDDEGTPTFTAKGGVGDISIEDPESDSLVEVTTIKNRQQSIQEIPAVKRHLEDVVQHSDKKNHFSLFIAPSIHADTRLMIDFIKYQYNLDIIGLSIIRFTTLLPSLSNIGEYLMVGQDV